MEEEITGHKHLSKWEELTQQSDAKFHFWWKIYNKKEEAWPIIGYRKFPFMVAIRDFS